MGCEHYGDAAGGLIFGNPPAVKNDADARRHRRGEADPDKFEISFAGLLVAGSVIRDFVALNKVEMLPWDVRGAQLQPGTTFDRAQFANSHSAAQQVRIYDPNSPLSQWLENMPQEVRQKQIDHLWEDFKARTARSS